MVADVSVDGMTSQMELKPFYKVFANQLLLYHLEWL
jgi:hypothetical protein